MAQGLPFDPIERGADAENLMMKGGKRLRRSKRIFTFPLLAVKNLESRGIGAWPALMEDLFNEAEINQLNKTLREKEIRAELELECLETYPFVLENLRKRGVLRRGK